jgi:hypothetical protein
VLVLRADDMSGYGRVPVRAELLPYDPIQGHGAAIAQAAGETGPDGRWRVEVAPAPAGAAIRISASLPGNPSRTLTPGAPQNVTLIGCPPGVEALVCEVAERQGYFQDVLAAAAAAWGGVSSFAIDQAHAAVESYAPKDARLARHWAGELSWAVADREIPPKDWPIAIRNLEQLLAIYSEIPFPAIADTDWFSRCAFGTPIWRSKDGKPLSAANFRLYSPTHSDFFPRSDRAIRVELAARYILNIAAIVDCIDHKFRKRLREVQRTARAMSTLGLGVAFLLGPIAGATGIGNAITEMATYAYANLGQSSSELQAGGNVVSDGVLSGTEPGIDLLVAAGLTAIVARLGRDADPRVSATAQAAVPGAVRAVAGDAQAGALAEGATDAVSLQGAASFGVTLAIRLLVSSMRAVGARSAQEFKEIALEVGNLEPEIHAFVLWCADQLLIDSLYQAAEEELAREGTPGVLTVDPATGQVLRNGAPSGLAHDPATGLIYDPATGLVYDPATGMPTGSTRDPATGQAVGPDGRPVTVGAAGGLSKLAAPAGAAAVLAAMVAAGIIGS